MKVKNRENLYMKASVVARGYYRNQTAANDVASFLAMTGVCPVRDIMLVETNVHAKQKFPVREITSVETYVPICRVARRALTDYTINDVDVLTDKCRASGIFSTDVISLTGNLIKPNVSSTNIKSLTGLKPSVTGRVIANAVKQSSALCFWIASFLAMTSLRDSRNVIANAVKQSSALIHLDCFGQALAMTLDKDLFSLSLQSYRLINSHSIIFLFFSFTI
jgi:hypothetical protein